MRLVVLALLLSCTPKPLVGACDMPATEHEGFTMYACAVDTRDDANVCCAYSRDVCVVIVCAKGCGDWVVSHRECGGKGVSL